MNIKTFIISAAVILWFSMAQSQIIEMNSKSEFESFMKTPNNHPYIPNNSFAGFQYGKYNFFEGKDLIKKAFPEYQTINVKQFGAKGDGETDDTQAVLTALDSLKDGEVLYFPEGKYVIKDILRIKAGNRALKGDGPDKTVLLFQRSLSDILGKYIQKQADGKYINRWFNHGGLIWVAPGDAWDENNKYVHQNPGPKGLDPGWTNAKTIGQVQGEAKRGDRTITIKCPTKLSARDFEERLLILAWKNDPMNELLVHMGGHESFRKYDWKSASRLSPRDWSWTVEVNRATTKGEGIWELELRQPLRIDIRKAWNVELRTPRSSNGTLPYIENFSIQGMTLRMKEHSDFIHLQDMGYNGVYFQRSFNCFIYDVNVFNADNSITAGASKCITIKKTQLLGDKKRHHGYYFRFEVHDGIVTDFYVGDCGNEALSVSYRSSGCVFHNGNLKEGTIDSHRGLCFDLIRSNIKLVSNQGNQGGGTSAGPRNGARVVHWNITSVTGNGTNIAEVHSHPSGVLAGIFADEYILRNDPAMPLGSKNTLVAPLNREAKPRDLYRAIMRK